jgi:deazaflavin-dependent oxidoreductase (nitroreductase family)
MASDEFGKALNRRREISITVTGRRTGSPITIPVWFVADDRTLWLLPVSGSQTQWFRNLQKNPAITIDAGAERKHFHAKLIGRPEAVNIVVQQFQEKYTPEEIKRYYTGLDVAVQIPLPGTADSKLVD